MKAVLATGKGLEFVKIEEVPIPEPGPNEIRIKTKAAAFNPVDQLIAGLGVFVQSYPTALGCDAAGVVDAVGSEVKNFQVGERVFCHSGIGYPNHGTFAEHFIMKSELVGKLPESCSFEQGSTFSVAALTAGFALFGTLKLPLPSHTEKKHGEFFLVWGGSSSVGCLAIQFAALIGFHVITTCSPKNFEYAKRMGAAHTLDYNDPNVVEEIRKLSGGNLHYAFDAVGGDGPTHCVEAMRTHHHRPAHVASCAGAFKGELPSHMTFSSVVLGDALGKPEKEELWAMLQREIDVLVAHGKLKSNDFEVIPNGLNGVGEGLRLLAEKKVSGKKLVIVL